MKNGMFTPAERELLAALDAVEAVTARRITYSKKFKVECMRRYHAGDKPGRIFADAGLPASLIGGKRIERAIAHWKEAEAKDCLTGTDGPAARRSKRIESLKREKREAVARQRAIRDRRIARMEDRMARQRKRSEEKERRIIAAQAARIASLEAQVKALKALGALAKRTRRAPGSTMKAERFEIIMSLAQADPKFNVSAACRALEVSRRGYYDWLAAAPARAARQAVDDRDALLVREAAESHGARKGGRQIADWLRRVKSAPMNLKKIRRLMRKYGIVWRPRRRNPYRPIGTDGLPKIAPDAVARDFRRGAPRSVLSTDITYLPCTGAPSGFTYLSAVIDCQTNEILAHKCSTSLEEPLVIDTLDQLKDAGLTPETWICSDQGVHYTALAYRAKLAELGVRQSMSKKACCWDNSPIESFWGRLKEQIGPTKDKRPQELEHIIDEYIHYYNHGRGQARLGWKTPKEYARQLAG